MTTNIVVAGAKWRSVKWWDPAARNRDGDEAERAALSVQSLRKAGFLAKISESHNEDRTAYCQEHGEDESNYPYVVLIRVEVYGDANVHARARHHLRGFWAALESRGLPQDYREGYSAGVGVLQRIAAGKPDKLPAPTPNRKRLSA